MHTSPNRIKSSPTKGLQILPFAGEHIFSRKGDTLSKLHRNFLSIIRYGLLPSVGKHHRKPAGLQHALVFALARPQGQTARRIVPRHRDLRISAFLVIVIVKLVPRKARNCRRHPDKHGEPGCPTAFPWHIARRDQKARCYQLLYIEV